MSNFREMTPQRLQDGCSKKFQTFKIVIYSHCSRLSPCRIGLDMESVKEIRDLARRASWLTYHLGRREGATREPYTSSWFCLRLDWEAHMMPK